jgi:hypothetical protein
VQDQDRRVRSPAGHVKTGGGVAMPAASLVSEHFLKSPTRFPQQRTWSVPMISPPIWELPKTA